MAGQYGGQPVVIVDPSKEQIKGKDALSMNIYAAKAVSNIVKTTLGPKGMDKMLVNPIGDIILTNDGATILGDMEIEHPAAKMVVEVSRTQDEIAGDGTTSAVVITGSLLDKAGELMDEGIHPTMIVNGYRMAAQKAIEILENYMVTIKKDDREMLQKIAATSITGKTAEGYSDLLSGISVDAVLAVEENGKVDLAEGMLSTHEVGGKIADTELFEGVVLNKWALDDSMPKRVENPKIALIDTPVEVGKTSTKSKVQITSAEQLGEFKEKEKAEFKRLADAIIRSGANAVFCSKNIDPKIAAILAENGIYATRRVGDQEMKNISRATGARLVRNLEELEERDLGSAGLLEQEGEGDGSKTFLKECNNAKTVTVIIHGGTQHVIDNIERAFDDMMHAVRNVVEDGEIVAGGGAAEIEVAAGLRSYAATIGGREQLAISAFADAVEEIPRILAENAGLDTIDTMVKLRAKHGDIKNAGLDVYNGEPVDMLEKGVVDPLRVKKQAIKSASEAAVMILRVDDMLRAQRREMMDVKPEHNIHNYDMSGMM